MNHERLSIESMISQLLVRAIFKESFNNIAAVELFDVIIANDLIDSSGCVFHGSSRKTRLAIAIIIVASEQLKYYHVAFRIISGDWGFVRGRFWVVCEELLRHNAYSSIEEALNSSFPSKSDFYELSCSFLAFIFSDDSTSHVTNTMLRARLTNLHHNLESLVANIKCSLEPKVYLDEQKAMTPLYEFIPWFITWAKNLLVHVKGPIDDISKTIRDAPIMVAISAEKRQCIENNPSSTKRMKETNADREYVVVKLSQAVDTADDFAQRSVNSASRNLEEAFGQEHASACPHIEPLVQVSADDHSFQCRKRSVTQMHASNSGSVVTKSIEIGFEALSRLGLQAWQCFGPLDSCSSSPEI